MPHRRRAQEELSDLFSVLAHPLRLALVFRLREGEADVTDLMGATSAPQTAVSQALARLRSARLVTTRKEGRHIVYRLTLSALPSWLDGGLQLLEDETAQMAELHEVIAQARHEFGGNR